MLDCCQPPNAQQGGGQVQHCAGCCCGRDLLAVLFKVLQG
jgi:hypothetical protein